jgi:hypothetical protein
LRVHDFLECPNPTAKEFIISLGFFLAVPLGLQGNMQVFLSVVVNGQGKHSPRKSENPAATEF